MKNLQNHIFSTTTCISKETMLKFINKQLSQKELHQVQIHLIDCDFCSEAIEGLVYAKNPSILFTIDHQIDQRISKKSPSIARIILVAASILLFIFGGYYTFNTFNDAAKITENEISFQEPKKDVLENLLPEQEQSQQEQNLTTLNKSEKNTVNAEVEENIAYDYQISDESPGEETVSTQILDGFVRTQKDKEVIVTGASANKNEKVNTDPSVMDVESEMVLQEKTQKETTKSNSNTAYLSAPQIANKAEDADSKKSNNTKNGENNVPGVKVDREANIAETEIYKQANKTKQRAKKVAEPQKPISVTQDNVALYDEKPIEQEKNVTRNTSTTVEMSGGVSTGEAMNFRSVLTDAKTDFDAKNYQQALNKFELITDKSLEYETKWYKALCLIELNNKPAAKKLLNELTYVNNPFSKKAEEKLLEMN